MERNYSPERYLKARPFIERLKRLRGRLPSDRYVAMKDRALSGDIRGAEAMLEREWPCGHLR